MSPEESTIDFIHEKTETCRVQRFAGFAANWLPLWVRPLLRSGLGYNSVAISRTAQELCPTGEH